MALIVWTLLVYQVKSTFCTFKSHIQFVNGVLLGWIFEHVHKHIYNIKQLANIISWILINVNWICGTQTLAWINQLKISTSTTFTFSAIRFQHTWLDYHWFSIERQWQNVPLEIRFFSSRPQKYEYFVDGFVSAHWGNSGIIHVVSNSFHNDRNGWNVCSAPRNGHKESCSSTECRKWNRNSMWIHSEQHFVTRVLHTELQNHLTTDFHFVHFIAWQPPSWVRVPSIGYKMRPTRHWKTNTLSVPLHNGGCCTQPNPSHVTPLHGSTCIVALKNTHRPRWWCVWAVFLLCSEKNIFPTFEALESEVGKYGVIYSETRRGLRFYTVPWIRITFRLQYMWLALCRPAHINYLDQLCAFFWHLGSLWPTDVLNFHRNCIRSLNRRIINSIGDCFLICSRWYNVRRFIE